MGQRTELEPLKSTRFRSISHMSETGSTNADLLAQANQHNSDGQVLLADHQTAGRGRQNRTWHDDPGSSLLVSVLLHLDRSIAPVVPFLVGMAAVDTVAQMTTPSDEIKAPVGESVLTGPAGLKWPNDVLAPLFDERKLAGILAESTTHGGDSRKTVVVAGMGLNLRWSRIPPEQVADTAVTLEEILGRPTERNDVLYRYLTHLETWLQVLESDGAATIINGYRNYCLTLGRRVRFVTSTGEVAGIAEGVAESGALQIRADDNSEMVELFSGDAHHV